MKGGALLSSVCPLVHGMARSEVGDLGGVCIVFCRFSVSFLFGFGIMGVVLQGSERCRCAFVGLVWRFAGCCNLVGSLLHFLVCCCGG